MKSILINKTESFILQNRKQIVSHKVKWLLKSTFVFKIEINILIANICAHGWKSGGTK